MKKFLLLFSLFSLFNVVQGYAASHFSALKEMYDQGIQPGYSELSGWFSGRCYFRSHPDQAFPALLFGIPVEMNYRESDPQFPVASASASDVMKIALKVENGVPDMFDHLSSSQILAYEKSLAQTQSNLFDASWEDDYVQSSLSGDSFTLYWYVKKSGDKIFLKQWNSSTNFSKFPYEDGFCYFFQKVR